eukprot:TRINITY_DN458_c0_g2_i5.p1 TRINITY_DN458_c0_g2~~TRINITY_DN458_c0_g2_i5.p1  ORF type:complete len:734 (-),score=148.99 TRINITY_DN458_c0_g2_i5:249-2450(-)
MSEQRYQELVLVYTSAGVVVDPLSGECCVAEVPEGTVHAAFRSALLDEAAHGAPRAAGDEEQGKVEEEEDPAARVTGDLCAVFARRPVFAWHLSASVQTVDRKPRGWGWNVDLGADKYEFGCVHSVMGDPQWQLTIHAIGALFIIDGAQAEQAVVFLTGWRDKFLQQCQSNGVAKLGIPIDFIFLWGRDVESMDPFQKQSYLDESGATKIKTLYRALLQPFTHVLFVDCGRYLALKGKLEYFTGVMLHATALAMVDSLFTRTDKIFPAFEDVKAGYSTVGNLFYKPPVNVLGFISLHLYPLHALLYFTLFLGTQAKAQESNPMLQALHETYQKLSAEALSTSYDEIGVEVNGCTCLDLAVQDDNKVFVEHMEAQKFITERWRGEPLVFFRSASVKSSSQFWSKASVKRFLLSPRGKYVLYSTSYIIFLLLLLCSSLTSSASWKLTPVEILIMVMVCGLISSEVGQSLKTGLRKYLSSVWNLLDMFSLALQVIWLVLLVVACTTHSHAVQAASNDVFGVACVMAYVRVIAVFSTHNKLGPLQIIILRIIKDLALFVVVAFVFFLGFTVAITRVMNYGAGRHDPGVVFKDTLITLFWSIFTMTDLEADEDNHSQALFVRFLYGAYIFIMVIVLLNILIAMMNNTFSSVENQEQVEWKFHRIELLHNYGSLSTLPPPFSGAEMLFTGVMKLVRKNHKVADPTRTPRHLYGDTASTKGERICMQSRFNEKSSARARE